MPPKRSNIGRLTRQAIRVKRNRSDETDEQRAQRNRANRQRIARSRALATYEDRQSSNMEQRIRMRQKRAVQDQSRKKLAQQNLNVRTRRQMGNHEINDNLHTSVAIGSMNKVCAYCKALKSNIETPGCANGKVKLPASNSPPEPLRSMVSGTTPQSELFLTNNQNDNSENSNDFIRRSIRVQASSMSCSSCCCDDQQ